MPLDAGETELVDRYCFRDRLAAVRVGERAEFVAGARKIWSLDAAQINAIFFAGSIPFTTAGYLQLYQAANADESARWYVGTTAANFHWVATT